MQVGVNMQMDQNEQKRIKINTKLSKFIEKLAKIWFWNLRIRPTATLLKFKAGVGINFQNRSVTGPTTWQQIHLNVENLTVVIVCF